MQKLDRAGAGAPFRHRLRLVAGLSAALSLASCGDGPAEPVSQLPVLSNFSYTVEALNLESCPPSGLANASRIRWNIDFEDPDGDVAPPVLTEWSSSFSPSGTTKAALLLIPAGAIVREDDFSGTISQTQCVRFGEQESMDITLSIYDAEGHSSNPRTLRIERPEGAQAPPAP